MTEPIWYSYEYSYPQQDLPIIIERRGPQNSRQEIVVVPAELELYFNVSGLRWRPTGIFTEMGGSITREGELYGQASNALGGCGGFSAILGGLGAIGVSAGGNFHYSEKEQI